MQKIRGLSAGNLAGENNASVTVVAGKQQPIRTATSGSAGTAEGPICRISRSGVTQDTSADRVDPGRCRSTYG